MAQAQLTRSIECTLCKSYLPQSVGLAKHKCVRRALATPPPHPASLKIPLLLCGRCITFLLCMNGGMLADNNGVRQVQLRLCEDCYKTNSSWLQQF